MNYPSHPTYQEIHDGCIAFTKFIVNPPDLIVGLLRGGMFNAVLLSHIYHDVSVIALDYASSNGEGDQRDSHNNIVPELPHPLSRFADLTVLLVDDICDSGYTMKEVTEVYKGRGHEVRSYVSYLKSSAVFQPSGWSYLIPEDAPWIVFPWEDVV